MFEKLLVMMLKISFDFGIIAYFISNGSTAFLQLRMPTLTLLFVSAAELFNLLIVFIEYESVSCYYYALLYTFLPIAMLTVYTVMNSKLYLLANIKHTRQSNRVKWIASLICSHRMSHQWDNAKQVAKDKKKKIITNLMLMIIPSALNLGVYGLILGDSIITGKGQSECKPLANVFTILFYIVTLGFNLKIITSIDFQTDIFKLKNSFYLTFVMVYAYGLLLVVQGIFIEFGSSSGINMIVLNVFNSLLILSFTLYPSLLRLRKPVNKFNILEIVKNKSMWSKFSFICTASLCNQYCNYLDEFAKLDTRKPLLVQNFIKKYFEVSSPCYLDLQVWSFDFAHPDAYTLVSIERYIKYYLDSNFVKYLTPNAFEFNLTTETYRVESFMRQNSSIKS